MPIPSERHLYYYRDIQQREVDVVIVLYAGAHTLPVEDRVFAVPLEGLWA